MLSVSDTARFRFSHDGHPHKLLEFFPVKGQPQQTARVWNGHLYVANVTQFWVAMCLHWCHSNAFIHSHRVIQAACFPLETSGFGNKVKLNNEIMSANIYLEFDTDL